MPAVDNYQRIDRQNTDETSHQVNKQSVDKQSNDQTRNEVRIESRSTRDAIEDTGVVLGKLSAGNNSKGFSTTRSLGNEAVSEYSETSDLAVNPQVTADQFDDLIASGDIHNSSNKDFQYSTEQSDDQFGKVESFSSAEKNNTVESDTALDSRNAIDRSRSDPSEITSHNGFIEDVGSANNNSLEGGFEMTDGAYIDSIENLTLEQAFDFLIEQTEDNYEEPTRLLLQQTK